MRLVFNRKRISEGEIIEDPGRAWYTQLDPDLHEHVHMRLYQGEEIT